MLSVNKEIMNMMKDFGKHECIPPNELKTELTGNKFSATAYKLNFISNTEKVIFYFYLQCTVNKYCDTEERFVDP